MNRRQLLKASIAGVMTAAGATGLLKIYKHASGVQPISTYPDPVLRTRSEPVERIDSAVTSLADHLTATVRYYSLKSFFTEAALGRGLAAPQLGVTRRVIVCGIQGELKVLINPRITSKRGSHSGPEYCLSLPEQEPRNVQRPAFVKLAYRNIDGRRRRLRATGADAAVIAHEIDHLNGILYIDYS